MPASPSFRSTATAFARVALALTVAIGLAACAIGPSLQSFTPASSATGIDVRLAGRLLDVRGELVAVRDSAAIVRDASRVLLIPWSRVQYLWVAQYGEYRLPGRGALDPGLFEKLRRVSRFPQGLTPEIERALLAATGLTALETLP